VNTPSGVIYRGRRRAGTDQTSQSGATNCRDAPTPGDYGRHAAAITSRPGPRRHNSSGAVAAYTITGSNADEFHNDDQCPWDLRSTRSAATFTATPTVAGAKSSRSEAHTLMGGFAPLVFTMARRRRFRVALTQAMRGINLPLRLGIRSRGSTDPTSLTRPPCVSVSEHHYRVYRGRRRRSARPCYRQCDHKCTGLDGHAGANGWNGPGSHECP